MDNYITVQEAAALWQCSPRSVQLVCKAGRIPGARKVSGVWLLPGDAVHPGRETAAPGALHPERLYGKNTTVRLAPAPEEQPSESGCLVTEYAILEGMTLVFQDIHEEKLDYGGQAPQLPGDLIAIQHCREGRFEGEYPNGECIYMGPGSLAVNLPAWAPAANSFPLRHYHGFYIAILPQAAAASLRKLEAVLGPLGIDLGALTGQLSGRNHLALFARDEAISRQVAAIYAAGRERKAERLRLGVLGLVQVLCAQESRAPGPEAYFTREQVRSVKEVRRYLLEHLDEHIPLPELAKRFHLSLTAMKSCFKGVYGQSMGRYLREYRLQAGAERLAETEERIIHIAASLGYKNASKFSAAFAARYGMSPGEYRKTFCPQRGFSGAKE